MWTKVGERVGKIRTERNLTRAQFGRMIGLSEQYVGRIERGAQRISGAAIVNICNTTGVSSDYILFGVTDPAVTAAALNGLSREQIGIGFDLLMRLAHLINTKGGNNALTHEVFLQQQALSDG